MSRLANQRVPGILRLDFYVGAGNSNPGPSSSLCIRLYLEQFPNPSVLILLRDSPLTSIKADLEVKISLSPALKSPTSDKAVIKTEILGDRIQGLQALLKSAAPAAVWCHSAWQIPRARCRAVPWHCFCSLSLSRRATPISPGILLNRWVLKWHGSSIHNKDLELQSQRTRSFASTSQAICA